jgi:type IV pilus assembly protein PilM
MNGDTFALDINEKYTRMCKVHINKGKLELISLGYDTTAPNFYISQSDTLVQQQTKIITQLHTNLKINTRKVHVILPDSFTYSQVLEMPYLKEKELTSAIKYQADEFIPMPIDEVYLDIEILKEDEKAKKLLILIVASPKKIVDQLYQTLLTAKLVPETLENELSSLGRFVSEIVNFRGTTSLFVNFGYSTTSIYLIDGTTGLILMTRNIKMGIELLLRDLKVNLNWDDQKAIEALKTIGMTAGGSVDLTSIISPFMKELLRELEKMILLAREKFNSTVGRIVTFNYDSYVANFPTSIQSQLSLPTQTMPLKDILTPNPITQSFAPELSSFLSVISGNLR